MGKKFEDLSKKAKSMKKNKPVSLTNRFKFEFFMEVNCLSSDKKKGKMTVEEAGRMGGEKTSETHGEEFYSEIGRKGGQKVRKLIRRRKRARRRIRHLCLNLFSVSFLNFEFHSLEVKVNE